MANTISNMKMTNPIKGLVSKRRKRYTEDGFNLDLTCKYRIFFVIILFSVYSPLDVDCCLYKAWALSLNLRIIEIRSTIMHKFNL